MEGIRLTQGLRGKCWSEGMSKVCIPQSKIRLPEITALSGKLGIMKNEVTVSLFRQVLPNYKVIPGDGYEGSRAAKALQAVLADPSIPSDQVLTNINLFDAREFAGRLSALSGRIFRVPAKTEVELANSRVSGSHSIWTESYYTEVQFEDETWDFHALCSLSSGLVSYDRPEIRSENFSIILVEDR